MVLIAKPVTIDRVLEPRDRKLSWRRSRDQPGNVREQPHYVTIPGSLRLFRSHQKDPDPLNLHLTQQMRVRQGREKDVD